MTNTKPMPKAGQAILAMPGVESLERKGAYWICRLQPGWRFKDGGAQASDTALFGIDLALRGACTADSADWPRLPQEVVERYLLHGHEPNDREFKQLVEIVGDWLADLHSGEGPINAGPDDSYLDPAPDRISAALKLPTGTRWLEVFAATVDSYLKNNTRLLHEAQTLEQKMLKGGEQ